MFIKGRFTKPLLNKIWKSSFVLQGFGSDVTLDGSRMSWLGSTTLVVSVSDARSL